MHASGGRAFVRPDQPDIRPVLAGRREGRALQTGPRPCGLWATDERARFVRRGVTEILNSHNEWEPKQALGSVPLGNALVRENDHWVRALTLARMLDGLGPGNLCRLQNPNR